MSTVSCSGAILTGHAHRAAAVGFAHGGARHRGVLVMGLTGSTVRRRETGVPVFVLGLALALLGLALAVVPAARAGEITDLGSFWPRAINASNAVAGYDHPQLGNANAVWRSGAVTDLATGDPDVTNHDDVTDINDAGRIAGQTFLSGAGVFSAWWDGLGALHTIAHLDGTGPGDHSSAINAGGDVVGTQQVGANADNRAFFAPGGSSPVEVGAADVQAGVGRYSSSALGVDDAGAVLGTLGWNLPTPFSGTYLWPSPGAHGTPIDLDLFTAYHPLSADGAIIGTRANHAWLRTPGGTEFDLGSQSNFQPYAVNASHVIVGEGANRAWEWADGVIHNLNDDLPKDSGWVLNRAFDINEQGTVVGLGTHNGVPNQGYLLTTATKGALSGDLVDRNQTKLPGAQVKVTGKTDDGDDVAVTLTADAGGHYATRLDPGTYVATPAGDPPDQSGGKWDSASCDGTGKDSVCTLRHLGAGDDLHAGFSYTRCGAAENAPADKPATDCPVIFIHGFLGSRIACGAQELWPNDPSYPNIPSPNFAAMTLLPDGETNTSGACSGQAAVTGLVDRAGGADVYGSAQDFVNGLEPGRAYVYTYDWRRSVDAAVPGLDALIDQILLNTGADRVAIMAHSMGGLVTRDYIDDPARAKKVLRAVTIGTPYWGAPKAHFMLLEGDTDTPAGDKLDLLVKRGDLQGFARTTQGGFWLYPSAKYGPWLSVSDRGGQLSGAALDTWVAALGANPKLLDNALAGHARIDSFQTNGVDYTAVVGAGVPTVDRMDITEDNAVGVAELHYASGDGTVPLVSASQGASAGAPVDPAVHLRYVCNIEHMAETGTASVRDAVRDFLVKGSPVAEPGSDAGCSMSGDETKVFSIDPSFHVSASAAGDALTLDQARRQGLVDDITIGGSSTIVGDRRRPVTLKLTGRHIALRTRSLDGSRAGAPRFYGPVDGPLTVSPAGVVKRAGKTLKPRAADRTPPKTTATVTRRGARFVVHLRAKDASGVAATYLRIGTTAPKRYRKAVTLTARQLAKARYSSVDRFGNLEHAHPLRRPPAAGHRALLRR